MQTSRRYFVNHVVKRNRVDSIPSYHFNSLHTSHINKNTTLQMNSFGRTTFDHHQNYRTLFKCQQRSFISWKSMYYRIKQSFSGFDEQKSNQKKEAVSFYNSAVKYYNGIEVEKDLNEAIRLFTLAAEHGLPEVGFSRMHTV